LHKTFVYDIAPCGSQANLLDAARRAAPDDNSDWVVGNAAYGEGR